MSRAAVIGAHCFAFLVGLSVGETHKYFCQPRAIPFAGLYLNNGILGFALYEGEEFAICRFITMIETVVPSVVISGNFVSLSGEFTAKANKRRYYGKCANKYVGYAIMQEKVSYSELPPQQSKPGFAAV